MGAEWQDAFFSAQPVIVTICMDVCECSLDATLSPICMSNVSALRQRAREGADSTGEEARQQSSSM